MYNVEIVCVYPYYDDELLPHCPMQLEPDFMKEYVDSLKTEELSNCLYKANFLESFNLNDYNEEIINREIKWLYILLVRHDRFKECMRRVCAKYLFEDLNMGFMILFSYEYFFLTHACVCEYLKTNEMPTLDKLEEYITFTTKEK